MTPSHGSDENHAGQFIYSATCLTSAWIFSILSIIVSFWEMYKHLQYYNLPLLQRQVIRIIFMLPIYAFMSALSLSFEEYALYFAMLRDVYEALVIHCFLQMMLDYPGGEQKVVEGIVDR